MKKFSWLLLCGVMFLSFDVSAGKGGKFRRVSLEEFTRLTGIQFEMPPADISSFPFRSFLHFDEIDAQEGVLRGSRIERREKTKNKKRFDWRANKRTLRELMARSSYPSNDIYEPTGAGSPLFSAVPSQDHLNWRLRNVPRSPSPQLPGYNPPLGLPY